MSIRIRRALPLLLSDQRVLFLIVGAWNTIFGYLVFCAAHFIATDLGPTPLLLLSYSISLPHAYLTQKFVVFRTTGPWVAELTRFALANSIIFGTNLAFLHVLSNFAIGSLPVLQAAYLLVAAVSSFIIHKIYSFRSK